MGSMFRDPYNRLGLEFDGDDDPGKRTWEVDGVPELVVRKLNPQHHLFTICDAATGEPHRDLGAGVWTSVEYAKRAIGDYLAKHRATQLTKPSKKRVS